MALLKYTSARLAGDKLLAAVEAQPPVSRDDLLAIAGVMRLEVQFHAIGEEEGSGDIIVVSDAYPSRGVYYDWHDNIRRLGMFVSRVGVLASRAEGKTDETFDVERDPHLVSFVDEEYGAGPLMGSIHRWTEPGDRGMYLDPILRTGSESEYLLNGDLRRAGLEHLAATTVWGWRPAVPAA